MIQWGPLKLQINRTQQRPQPLLSPQNIQKSNTEKRSNIMDRRLALMKVNWQMNVKQWRGNRPTFGVACTWTSKSELCGWVQAYKTSFWLMIPRGFLLYVTRVAGNLPGLYRKGRRLAHVWGCSKKLQLCCRCCSLATWKRRRWEVGPRWIRLLTHHADILKYTTDQPESCALPTHKLRFFCAQSHGAASAAWFPRSVESH